ncbi:nicotinate (nicotinamide) nucleotide adenylyltransferase [Patescibacteria group bacterium]
MNITLFGGAFNPPHIGHLIVIQQAFDLIPTQELWLLPDNVGSFGKKLAPAIHRTEMAKLLIEELPHQLEGKVKLETTLIDENLSGETHEYMKVLRQKYPDKDFSFLMGSDNLKKFKKWQQWEDLIENLHFYVYPRSGHRSSPAFDNMTLLESDTQVITNFSSTIMRKRAEDKLSLKHFIPAKVLTYINHHQLYL